MNKYGLKWLFPLLIFSVFMMHHAFASPPDEAQHATTKLNAKELQPLQVFDISQGKVVKKIENSEKFQEFVTQWVDSVTGLHPAISTESRCGYVFRVPLSEPRKVQFGAQEIVTSSVFLFYCKQHDNLLLVFDDATRKPYLLAFSADLSAFLKAVDMQ
jgi:hypothetical protein